MRFATILSAAISAATFAVVAQDATIISANAALTRSLCVFAGPIGWVVTAVWTLLDIAGPAYRVTIPAVIQVAYMRAKMQYKLLEQGEYSMCG